jgi:hypothetical protein
MHMATGPHSERTAAEAPPAAEVISLSDVIDRPVYGRDDEELGSVINVFADLISHRLLYALLEVGGFVGIGSRRILVPFAALGWTDDRLYLPVERPVLERAPEWDRSSVLDGDYQAALDLLTKDPHPVLKEVDVPKGEQRPKESGSV